MKPAFQGSLDGMCGFYALANALMICAFDDGKRVIREAAKALPASRWPAAFLDGVSYADMQKMTRRLQSRLPLASIKISYPFKTAIPRSNAEYWDRFDEIFDSDDTICGIIGIEVPFAHWIVAGKQSGRVQLMDSTANNQFIRKNRSSFHAGKRRPKRGQWIVSPQELITFSSR